MNTARVGNASENFVADFLEGVGYTVASLRHRKGGGDILAHWPYPDRKPPFGHEALVEVKKCPSRGAVFRGGYFSKAQRRDMREMRLSPLLGERWLARVHGPTKELQIEWVRDDEWPCAKELKIE